MRVGESSSGESILLRISGELTKHAESVVLPLLLPDSPVVVWWPGKPPTNPSEDAIGQLARRRLTDAEATDSPIRSLKAVGREYAPGDTDLSWTRLTPWRALLAAALDQSTGKVTGGTVVAGTGNPAATLLVAWLESRLKVPITLRKGDIEQISSVVLHSAAGDVRDRTHRPDVVPLQRARLLAARGAARRSYARRAAGRGPAPPRRRRHLRGDHSPPARRHDAHRGLPGRGDAGDDDRVDCCRSASPTSRPHGRRPSVVLTGGTIAIDATRRSRPVTVDWTNVDFYWGDERFVPEGHADRNDQQAQGRLPRLGWACPQSASTRCLRTAATSAWPTQQTRTATSSRETRSTSCCSAWAPTATWRRCSPGSSSCTRPSDESVEVFNSPKPPPERITMTFPTLNNADAVWFLVSGDGKAEAVARALGDGTIDDTPATGVTGATETLWLLDEAAASQL